jgi:hypothetical protein
MAAAKRTRAMIVIRVFCAYAVTLPHDRAAEIQRSYVFFRSRGLPRKCDASGMRTQECQRFLVTNRCPQRGHVHNGLVR